MPEGIKYMIYIETYLGDEFQCVEFAPVRIHIICQMSSAELENPIGEIYTEYYVVYRTIHNI